MATIAYVAFFLIPGTTPIDPTLVLAQAACAAVAFIDMTAAALTRHTSRWIRLVAALLSLPPLVFLVMVVIGALTGGFVPGDK